MGVVSCLCCHSRSVRACFPHSPPLPVTCSGDFLHENSCDAKFSVSGDGLCVVAGAQRLGRLHKGDARQEGKIWGLLFSCFYRLEPLPGGTSFLGDPQRAFLTEPLEPTVTAALAGDASLWGRATLEVPRGFDVLELSPNWVGRRSCLPSFRPPCSGLCSFPLSVTHTPHGGTQRRHTTQAVHVPGSPRHTEIRQSASCVLCTCHPGLCMPQCCRGVRPASPQGCRGACEVLCDDIAPICKSHRRRLPLALRPGDLRVRSGQGLDVRSETVASWRHLGYS